MFFYLLLPFHTANENRSQIHTLSYSQCVGPPPPSNSSYTLLLKEEL